MMFGEFCFHERESKIQAYYAVQAVRQFYIYGSDESQILVA